jgi:hypothetical protein
MTTYKEHLAELLANSKGLVKKAALDSKDKSRKTRRRFTKAWAAFKEKEATPEGQIIDIEVNPTPTEES